MHALTAPELLDVWERGLAQSPIQRALSLLAAACSETPEALANLSIGQRDARLLTLREWTFGSHLLSLVICPQCGERWEFTINAADLRVMPEVEPTETLRLSVAGYELRFRLPNSFDLAAVPAAPTEVEDASAMLLDRCLVEARRDGEEVRSAQLPVAVREAIVGYMAEADPQAEIQLALACLACGENWQAPFDIESFFWGEISAWARRVLSEVHVLASAYGWREADILNLSAWRRQYYLNLIYG
jgi:hypothetical protein